VLLFTSILFLLTAIPLFLYYYQVLILTSLRLSSITYLTFIIIPSSASLYLYFYLLLFTLHLLLYYYQVLILTSIYLIANLSDIYYYTTRLPSSFPLTFSILILSFDIILLVRTCLPPALRSSLFTLFPLYSLYSLAYYASLPSSSCLISLFIPRYLP
jgi:hypothetical protein